MQAIAFYLSLPFIYLISVLPFPVLYLLSDLVFFLMYYVAGYRKEVVTENLRRSFPGRSEKEITALRRNFYRYLCDLVLETFKSLTIGKESMLKHCRMNADSVRLLDNYYAQKKNIILVLGHLGNWEWGGNAFSLQCKHPLYVIYLPLENKYFNRLIIKMRTRFGTRLIDIKNTFRDMASNSGTITATAFIADQTPPPGTGFWTTFLNQDTPVFTGTEKIARKLNYPVVYIHVNRTGRGHYELFAETLCEEPVSTSEGEISILHTRKLEHEILKNPKTWLWSHRRWKHKRIN